jgi:hypothetical protein
MYLTKEEKEELRILSKEVFGSRGKWLKILNNGTTELRKNGFGQPIQPIKVGKRGKVKQKTQQVYYTIDGIKTIMLEAKAKQAAVLEEMKNKVDDPK